MDDKNWVDRNFPRFAQLATMGSFCMVVIGYFYIVRPVFQYANLQEKAAKLEIENSAAEKKLTATAESQALAESQLAATRKELSAVAQSRDKLAAQLSAASQREIETVQRLAKVKSGLNAELLGAQRRILYSRFVFSGLTASLGDLKSGWNSTEKAATDESFIAAASDDWPNPFATVSRMLDLVE